MRPMLDLKQGESHKFHVYKVQSSSDGALFGFENIWNNDESLKILWKYSSKRFACNFSSCIWIAHIYLAEML